MVDTIKFSQMTAGGDLTNNEKTPGLLNVMGSPINVLFNNPWTFLPPGSTAQRPAPSSLINYRLRFNTDDQLYEYYDANSSVWIQIQPNSVGFPWSKVVVDTQMLPNNGYQIAIGTAINLTLPASSVFGQQINIMGFGGGLWTIVQGAGQQIVIGTISSTVGVGGSVSATAPTDSLILVCAEDNLTWQILGGPQGNLSIV